MAVAAVKGDLALDIDEDELQASITFTPDAEGAEWTAEKIMRIFMDARIGGYNQKRASELLQRLARAQGSVTQVIATGTAPEPPVPEFPEWVEMPIPPELAALASEVAVEAPPPLLYKIKFETIKVEKIVRKPAALRFLPPKVETVVTTERREKREQVYPDIAVLHLGWVRQGERIGILSQAKPGKAGKTISGQPIPPLVDDGTFYTGSGVQRRKNELVAEWDGIARIGERWVDVVPLPQHSWEVEISADGATYLLKYSPGDHRLPRPDPREILAKAGELGAQEDGLVEAEELASTLRQAVKSKVPLVNFSLSKNRDAKVEIKVSPDGVKATLSIWKGRGKGKPLALSEVSAALKASGVRGFKPDEFKKTVLDFYKGKEPELIDYPLAEGQAPGRGRSRVLSLLVSLFPEEKAAELRKRIAEQSGLSQALPSLGEFPIEEATKIALVQLGQKVAELPPAAPGSDGIDVYGKVLPGFPGNDPVIRSFENIDFNRDSLIASASGLLLADERDKLWRLRVLRFRDSTIEVSIAADSMSAAVTLVAEEGFGSPLTVENTIAALTGKGLNNGLEPYAIAEAVSDARAGKPVLKRVVVRGRPPRAGGSVETAWLVHKATGALYKMQEGNRADFRERDTMTRVSVGDPILKLSTAGDAGEDGLDVFGRPIKAVGSEKSEQAPEHDATIREEKQEDGSTLFVAAANGELVIEGLFSGGGNRVYIRERLSVEGDVGTGTGNIKFPGAVQVRGSLRAGYSLVAGGDVSITGAVEASLLSSDGFVRVAEGIKGGRKGTIRARLGIEASFAEQALLLAVEDVKIKNDCVLCNVKTNGRLLVASEKGALIGGLCRARKGIDVAVLGSENFAKTEVSFGQDYLVADQIEAEEREIEKLKSLILQSDRTMAVLEQAGAALDQIRMDKVKLVKLLEKRAHRIFDLREKFEMHVASEVRVRGMVFPGVILESHNRFFEVRSKKAKVVFSFDPQLGRIIERPL
jgi:uncharacterized protein